MLYYHFDKFLCDREIELVIFSNIPHEGPDYILYKLAKRRNIKTILCYQSIFPKRFFISTSMADFGTFTSIPSLFKEHKITIENNFKQDLFYMLSILSKSRTKNSPLIIRITSNARSKYALLSKFIFRQLKMMLPLAKRHHQNPHKKTNLQRFQNLALSIQYKKISKKHFLPENKLLNLLNSGKKIAYFPLHLQPELTTSAIGNIYQDQLYALECLEKLLDKSWVILVKENPKQGHFQRDALFYKRLANIPRTYLAESDFPSISIIEKCQLVTTITGTAGWEAIKGGKKCLVFGQAWYSNLMNCLKYSPNLTQETLQNHLDQKVEFTEFYQSFDQLTAKMGVGIIDPHYIASVTNYDPLLNAQAVASSLIDIINNHQTNWQTTESS